MRPPYSVQFLSWQGLGPGNAVECRCQPNIPPMTPVIVQISTYWGGPSVGIPNSAVLLNLVATSQLPTIYSFNSGIETTNQPLYDHVEGRWVLGTVGGSPAEEPIFRFVNTSQGGANVDVHVSGFALDGSSPFFPFVAVSV